MGEPRVKFRYATAAYRLPDMVGRVGKTVLPYVFSVPQLAMAMTTGVVAWLTAPLWGFMLPGTSRYIAVFVAAVLVGWLSPHTSLDGRSPLASLAGVATYLVRPRKGRCHGQRVQLTSHRYGGEVQIED